MPASWKIFRIICALQMTMAALIILTSLFNFFGTYAFSDIARLLLFVLIMLLSIFAINTLNNNYPDTPITGSQKKTFNRLFLLNFILLAFLFGFTIAEYKSNLKLARLIGKPVTALPFGILGSMILYFLSLIFQFIVLYGLYSLRLLLYQNFMRKQFEFEKKE